MTSPKYQVLTYNGHKIYLTHGNYDSNSNIITIFKKPETSQISASVFHFVPKLKRTQSQYIWRVDLLNSLTKHADVSMMVLVRKRKLFTPNIFIDGHYINFKSTLNGTEPSLIISECSEYKSDPVTINMIKKYNSLPVSTVVQIIYNAKKSSVTFQVDGTDINSEKIISTYPRFNTKLSFNLANYGDAPIKCLISKSIK